MKKIYWIVLIVILLLLIIFCPKKIDLGGGMLPTQYYTECRGLYLQTYNDTPVDGTRGGWCFGKIESYNMPLGANPSDPKELEKVPVFVVPPELTKQEAERLVTENWGGYVPGEGSSFEVMVKDNYDSNFTYTVTAIYGQADDSISKVKKEAITRYQNNTWTLGQPTTTQSCWPGRGHQDFSAEPCI